MRLSRGSAHVVLPVAIIVVALVATAVTAAAARTG